MDAWHSACLRKNQASTTLLHLCTPELSRDGALVQNDILLKCLVTDLIKRFPPGRHLSFPLLCLLGLSPQAMRLYMESPRDR